MKRGSGTRRLRGALLALAAWLAGPASGAPESAEEIRECLRSNLPERTSVQRIELASRDRGGGTRTLEAHLHWKRFERGGPRVRIRVDAPHDLKGASYLVIEGEPEDEMFIYLPAVQKVRRITIGMLSDQLWGTDFSYEDVQRLQGIALKGSSERRPDAPVGERTAWVLETQPDPGEASSYVRVLAFIDPETCLALRTELYESEEEPRKVLLADPASFSREGERWMARDFEMRDLRDETASRLRVLEVEHDADVPDRIFSPALLGRGR
jgi:hypothetical protein